MRSIAFALLFASSALVAVPALAQTTASPSNASDNARHEGGPADLCHELLAYAEQKAAEPPKPQKEQAQAPAQAPQPRSDSQGSGTAGAGSVGASSSTDTSSQAAAPPTSPSVPGAAPEAASSGHATDSSSRDTGASAAGASVPTPDFKLAGGVTVQQVRDTAKGNDRQSCRDLAQKIRRAGGDMPAALIALAAYEPDPAKR